MLCAVIFDIDGTLVDSVDLHAKAWQRAFRAFGKHVPFHEVRRQIGKGGDQLLPVFFSQQELAHFGEDLEAYRSDLYKRYYLPRVRAFPGVRELFQRIRSDGRIISLASSAKADELATYKRLADVADLIEGETSADDAEHSKPCPDIFQAALAAAGIVRVEEAIAVGDTPYDAQAAGKIGLRTIGLLCGGFPEDDLHAAGCLAIYRDPADLMAQYEESPLAKPAKVAA
jgi:HAD superfamily hydrolase (TIGR01509 family)